MDKTIKRKWIKALRSGRYKQGQLQLYNETARAYCCLGVLCRVTKARRVDGEEFAWGDEVAWAELPTTLRRHLKITPKQQKKLIDLNDGEEASFKEIATYIEKNL